MQMIESSLYASQRTMLELQALAAEGLTTIVEPITFMGTPRRSAQIFIEDYERLIVAERARCASVGIEHLTLVGVPASDVHNELAAHQAIDVLPAFLGRTGVVGIGEVGLEACTQAEANVLRRQLRLASQTGMPIVIQAPTTRKTQAVAISLEIANDEGVRPERILVKGVDGETLQLVRGFGAWAGLTSHPAFLDKDRVADLIGIYGTEGLMVQSDAGRGFGDPFALGTTLQRLARAGLSIAQLETIAFHNPKWFYSQGLGQPQRRALALAASRR